MSEPKSCPLNSFGYCIKNTCGFWAEEAEECAIALMPTKVFEKYMLYGNPTKNEKPVGIVSAITDLETENARLKEQNGEMTHIIREWVEMRVDSKLVSDARNVLTKAEGVQGNA